MKPSWKDIEQDRQSDGGGADLPVDHISRVLERIGETADGKTLRAWLHDAVILRQVARGLDESALRDITAEKRFAHRLYELLEPQGASTDERKQRTAGRVQRPAQGRNVRV